MTQRRALMLVLLLAVLAGVSAWQMGWLATTPAPPPTRPTPTPLPRFQSAWATEQDWLVDRITRDIRAMAGFATTRTLPPADAPAVKLEAIRFEEHLFSPRSYEAIAREALGAPGAAAATGDSKEDARLLAALLDPRTGVLVSEDLALSRRLEAEPRDAGAHERAALVLGAFALRDCAGRSTDTRPALTRMTAHLALARAFRGGAEPGLAGRFAETVLVTLVGREGDALARLDALAARGASPPEKAWVRALRLRNTGDWRIARDEKRLTLLETLEEFRALVQGQDDAAALAWLDGREPALIPDWGRIALTADAPSVATGNRFADLSVATDLAEAAEVLALLRGAPANESDFLEALNERPAGSLLVHPGGQPRVAVLGWGLWADRFQRNLVFDLMMGNYHRGWLLGQPAERQAFAQRSRERFGRLEMYPLVLRSHAGDAQGYETAMAAVREIALRSPERLTGGHWELIRAARGSGPVPRDLPDQNAWFRPALPPGTLLDLGWRLQVAIELMTMAAPELHTLREQAPHNAALASFAAARQPGENRSAADLAAVYGPLAGFHMLIMSKLADAAWYDPVAFRERQGALCELGPEYCLSLGYRLAEMGFPKEAAVAYQKGFDGARDRVVAANYSRWLVDYYFDHGQTTEAEAVAREAAGVYSSAGLFTMGRLMERMGRLREAEEHYRRILDRYERADELAGFYYRQARVEKKPGYEAKLRDALALALPSGLEPLERVALPTPPTDGVVIRKENDNTIRCGIKWGHVIVGLDGFRIRDLRAYNVVNSLSQAPRMKLVVWRGKGYDDIDTELWDRNFRVTIETLAPAK